MVYSTINSSIYYPEKQMIDPEDRGYQSSMYELDILGKTVIVGLGKPKHHFSNKGVVFFPIYLVARGRIKSQIGLFEVRKERALEVIDDEGDIDVNQLDTPLIFGFVSESFIDRSGSDIHDISLSPPKKEDTSDTTETSDKNKNPEKLEKMEENDSEDVVILESTTKKSTSKEIERANTVLSSGVFENDAKIKPPPLLPEETESDVKSAPKYRPSQQDSWIVKFMSNKNYDIHEVEANGDCLFAVVRDAYKQIGKITTVAKLRSIVAKEATQKVFENQRNLFLELDSIVKQHDKRLRELKDTLENDLKQRAKKSQNNPEVLAKILEDKKKMKLQYDEELVNRRHAKNMIDENVGDFSNIHSLEEFRAYILTSSYWADIWSISVLERVLQMKMIMFSQRSYIEGAKSSIIQCGEVDEELRRSKKFKPRFYIMTSFSGDHFRLVSYKDKCIFEYHEIPYNIRMLIINKCIQRAEGPFYMIEEFREFAAKLGAEEDLRRVDGDNEEEDDETDFDKDTISKSALNDLYDPKTVFVFHARAEVSKKPGKGTNEKIDPKDQTKFLPIHGIDNWRRKLDDKWMGAIFSVQGKKWASVEHFYQGAKFRKQNTEFRELFSLTPDAISDLTNMNTKGKREPGMPIEPTIATSIVLAEVAGSKNGKTSGKNSVQIRPTNITIDPDFYGGRNDQERETALRAKFSQNEDLKQLLIATYPAKLMHYTSGPPKADISLMVVRKELLV